MNNRSLSLITFGALALIAPHTAAQAQTTTQTPTQTFTRPRTVQTPANASAQQTETRTQTPAPTQQQPAKPAPSPSNVAPSNAPHSSPPSSISTPSQMVVPSLNTEAQSLPPITLQPAKPISISKARKALQEAERLMRSRSTATASTPSTSWVTLSALDQESGHIHLLTLPKETFIQRGSEMQLTSNMGMPLRLRIVRANYVNTAVVVSDLTGRQLTPLVVEYPIEKFGQFREMAYYTSAHPALMTSELSKNGHSYVRTMLDLAHKRLKDKGKIISKEVVDIAERLCIVEHVDHARFKNESRADLYNEIFALFALNELNTYRYSVSSAGAGGMVQMIPSTYQMIRRQHPSVGLNPDFVAGMRNHGNALEAMLLYMQDTWNDLALNMDVLEAMRQNQATQPELAAAGYNSNPARLPLYIRRGGAGWRTLIPRETQMYLQIYKSVEGLVQFKNRADEKDQQAEVAPPGAVKN